MDKHKKKAFGEYDNIGEYHKEIDDNWKYYPIYITKMEYVEAYLGKKGANKRILDVGCGEGVLVEKYYKEGMDIIGLDKFFSSDFIIRGDITKMPFKSERYDLVLCLDVIEHLNFDEQEKALIEIRRVLRDDGHLLIAIPNLAHFASRISFLLTGNLIRTSKIERHKGDRPINEYVKLLRIKKFEIIKRKGLFPTFPISSVLTYCFPGKVVRLHRILNKLFAYPNFCFLNIIIARKASSVQQTLTDDL